MTPTSAIIELSSLDLMKLVEGAEVRIGVVSLRPGEQSTCSIIGSQEPRGATLGPPEPAFPERPSEAPEARRRPTTGAGPNVGTRKEITNLRYVRFEKPCSLCRQPVRQGVRAKWCPQTKDIFHLEHEDDHCLAMVLA